MRLIKKLKENTSYFFYKFKYLYPLFFLFFILIDYYFRPQFSFSTLFWINSIGFLLSLVGILIFRRKIHIIFRKTGLQVNSHASKILFPWLYIQKPYVTPLKKNAFLINLSSVHPGLSFHVKKYHFSTEGKRDSDWFELKKEGVKIQMKGNFNPETLRKQIECFTSKWGLESIENEYENNLNSIHLGLTNKSKGIVTINLKAKASFPSFCPMTGIETSGLLDLEMLKMPMSSRGLFLWKYRKTLRQALSLMIALSFISLGYIASFNRIEFFILGSIALSLLYIWGWNYLRAKIQILDKNEDTITLKFEDLEYSNALISTNFPLSESGFPPNF